MKFLLSHKVFRVFAFFFSALMIQDTAGAQTGITLKATVNRNRIYPGEQIEFSISLEYPRNKVLNKWVAVPDTFNHLEVLKLLKADSISAGDKFRIEQKYLLTGFDSGHWMIPAFAVSVSNKTIKTDSIGIDIIPVPLKGEAYHDIKEIIDVAAPPFDWTYWIAGAISVLVLAFLLWRLLRRPKQKEQPDELFETRLSPYEQAMEEMKKLKGEQLMEKGEVKLYYTRIYDILRVFLQRQLVWPILQSTTDEILVKLKGDYLQTESFSRVAETLRIADAVKFARYNSSIEEGKQVYQVIQEAIQLLHRQKT